MVWNNLRAIWQSVWICVFVYFMKREIKTHCLPMFIITTIFGQVYFSKFQWLRSKSCFCEKKNYKYEGCQVHVVRTLRVIIYCWLMPAIMNLSIIFWIPFLPLLSTKHIQNAIKYQSPDLSDFCSLTWKKSKHGRITQNIEVLTNTLGKNVFFF